MSTNCVGLGYNLVKLTAQYIVPYLPYDVNQGCVILFLSSIFDQSIIYLQPLRLLKSHFEFKIFCGFHKKVLVFYTILLVYYESCLLVGARFVKLVK